MKGDSYMNFRKSLVITSALAAALMAGGAFTAAAASVDTSNGYLAGQKKNSDRHAQYAELAGITDEGEREAYFQAHDIGSGGAYASVPHLNAESLVAQGIIDQGTADRIAAYGSQKHDTVHDRYAGMDGLTDDQRHGRYESFGNDGFSGDGLEELVNAGILTREQADLIAGQNPQ